VRYFSTFCTSIGSPSNRVTAVDSGSGHGQCKQVVARASQRPVHAACHTPFDDIDKAVPTLLHLLRGEGADAYCGQPEPPVRLERVCHPQRPVPVNICPGDRFALLAINNIFLMVQRATTTGPRAFDLTASLPQMTCITSAVANTQVTAFQSAGSMMAKKKDLASHLHSITVNPSPSPLPPNSHYIPR
jgi:hypothetical protein